MNSIDVIGIGLGIKDLTQYHLNLIESADVLVGGIRSLDLFPHHPGEKIAITSSIKHVINTIREKMASDRVVVLASGDPLFYGIGATLAKYFDRDSLRIHPNISSVSAGFAVIGESWHDATIISLHGTTVPNFSFYQLAFEHKVAFLTDPKKDPHFIAHQLIKNKIHGFRFCVFENIGHPELENIFWFDHYPDVLNQSFASPNIVILLRSETAPSVVSHETYIGLDDSLFRHHNGLITKSEIRSVSLSKLKLFKKNHSIWDIGSGSGSVGIEASMMNPFGKVVCIEKNPDRVSDIAHNLNSFNCTNATVVQGHFPTGIESLPSPDRIFIGGGGKNLPEILESACDHLLTSGVMVINTVLLENMHQAFHRLQTLGFNPDVVQIQVSRSAPMPFGHRFDALNPVWIISGSKP